MARLPAGQVKVLTVAMMARLVSEVGFGAFVEGLIERLEQDFRRWPDFQKSTRFAERAPLGTLELMPTSDQTHFACKYVCAYHGNVDEGLQTVAGLGLLVDVNTGYPLLISEMTLLTALRTAAVSVVAAKALALPDATTMAIIGNGAQADFQALAFHHVLGVKDMRLYDVDRDAMKKLEVNLGQHGISVSLCRSIEEAVRGAQIITTCTAEDGHSNLLTDNMVGSGVHINAIGGDCPDKTEIHENVLRRAQVFVEYEAQTREEGESQQLAADEPVTELWQVLCGQVPGRKDHEQITVFDGVGFAIEDYSALRHVHDLLVSNDISANLDLIAAPNNPKDLISLLELSS